MSFKRKKNGIIICTTEYITNKQYGGLAVFLEKFIKTLKQKYEINLIVSSIVITNLKIIKILKFTT